MKQTREDAWEFLTQKLKNDKLQKHCLSVAAVMEGLAEHFDEDKEKWFIAGLLHDIDYEIVDQDMDKHSILGAQWVKEAGYPEDVVRAVKVHNQEHGISLETRMEKALVAADGIAGLAIAGTLVLPDKKLASLTGENVVNRFGEKSFARGVDREEILVCEQLDLELNEFAEIAVYFLQKYADDLGL